MSHRLTIEHRGKTSVLICQHCQLPFVEIVDGEIRLQNKHGPKIHKNVLTANHLKLILFEIFRQEHPPDQGWTI